MDRVPCFYWVGTGIEYLRPICGPRSQYRSLRTAIGNWSSWYLHPTSLCLGPYKKVPACEVLRGEKRLVKGQGARMLQCGCCRKMKGKVRQSCPLP